MQYQKEIEQLGYSSREAKVYLASLRFGEAHVSDIANEVKMPRSTVQFIIDKLHADGLMNFYVMRRYKYWVAEKPEFLIEKLKERQDVISKVLPKLRALRMASRYKRTTDDPFYQKSVRFLSSFANSLQLPTLITNSDIEIVYVNAAWEREFGYVLDEIKGDNPCFLCSGQTPKTEYESMVQALKLDKLFHSEMIIDQRKDGTLIPLLTSIFPIYHGNRKFYIQILTDISKRDTAQAMFKNVSEDTDS